MECGRASAGDALCRVSAVDGRSGELSAELRLPNPELSACVWGETQGSFQEPPPLPFPFRAPATGPRPPSARLELQPRTPGTLPPPPARRRNGGPVRKG